MDFEDAEKIIEKAKTQPKKTITIVIVFAIIALAIAYGTTLVSEKAKQHAEPSIPAQKAQSETASTPDKKTSNKAANGTSSIEQHTKGDQSPAVVSDGDVEIKYGSDK